MKTLAKLVSPVVLVTAAFFALNVGTTYAGPPDPPWDPGVLDIIDDLGDMIPAPEPLPALDGPCAGGHCFEPMEIPPCILDGTCLPEPADPGPADPLPELDIGPCLVGPCVDFPRIPDCVLDGTCIDTTEPDPEDDDEPTATPTDEPTATPTDEPTATPTDEPPAPTATSEPPAPAPTTGDPQPGNLPKAGDGEGATQIAGLDQGVVVLGAISLAGLGIAWLFFLASRMNKNETQ